MKHTVEEVRLRNGARGLLIDVPGATVMNFRFDFRAGSRFVENYHDKWETAHIMEHLAFGANELFKSSHAFTAEFAKNGAYHNAFTSDISMGYMAECADFEWDRILDLQRLAICKPKFSNAELISEKGNVKSELTGCQNDYGRLLWPKVAQALGEDTLLFSQRLKVMDNTTLSDVKKHHQRTHTLNNMRFVIAGKMHGRKSRIKQMLEEWDLPAGKRLAMPVDEYSKSEPILIRRKDASNLTFGLSLSLPRRLNDSESNAMGCLSHILTGTLYSRIFGVARKEGLVYHMWSGTSKGTSESFWDFGGGVNYETSDALFDLIVKELQSVLAGKIKAEEVETAKLYALGRHQMGIQTVAQVSSLYSNRYSFDGHIRDYSKTSDRIKRISADHIIKIAREFVDANTWVLAAVGSCKKERLVNLNDKLTELFPLSEG